MIRRADPVDQTSPMPTAPDLCRLTLLDLLAKCERTAGQHRQNAQRWQRYAAMHQGPGGHGESLDKCMAKVKREMRLSEVWKAYAEALRVTLETQAAHTI
jgi:hypothetical protein